MFFLPYSKGAKFSGVRLANWEWVNYHCILDLSFPFRLLVCSLLYHYASFFSIKFFVNYRKRKNDWNPYHLARALIQLISWLL